MPDRGGYTTREAKPNASGRCRLILFDPTELEGKPIPQRQWIVDGWLPAEGEVTANFADGGMGKTLLAQQLMTSCATGLPWCGLPVLKCRTYGIFCEDNQDELHRRQAQINAAYGIGFKDLSLMRWDTLVGNIGTLVQFDQDGWEKTDLFQDMMMAIQVHQARLVIVDTAADTFGGNENDRIQVGTFIKVVLGELARQIDGAVLLNAHPSRSGLASGRIDSGSTGWNNSVRARWAMIRPPEVEGEKPDDAERILVKMKSNYSSRGDEIPLLFREGVLWPRGNPGGATSVFAAVAQRRHAEEVFLRLLDSFTKSNRPLSDSSHAGKTKYAPKAFAADPGRDGCTVQDFARAMSDLFAAGRIINRQYGRTSDVRHRIARAGEPDADPRDGTDVDAEPATDDPPEAPPPDA